ncbi:hypothetical protein EMIHUDRAFT_121199 [Emiliania huxleyi CCMP1516]|uniref:Uncharacterized protein n=2 Tax=Emiliania huxleyi TaxID=2903 RepID=A0A0D3I623_EMIH1|nr:hypothetical protein EMIHUDRAFT_121199 [Emiliania huxleyi CCMP1516]EOD06708.1 hypothetical protein EMIHUDRAFT_121199 [Emiliania huxleyi CCMP1516]|eukprot:XP_005759137.1 hypothetical protein EMIHUDRAFT_121199 [Emiliania huxleyi CCMP1516]
MAFASDGLPPPAHNAAAEGAARGRDGAQAADDGQRPGVKRRLDGELASARVGVDDAKGGDTIMVDATHMAAAAAAGTDSTTKRLLHVALAARDGTHIPDIKNKTALVTEIRQLVEKTPGCEAQPASAISVPIIGTSRAVCVAFSGESEARAFLEHHAGGGAIQLPAPDDVTIHFVALDASEWGRQAEARELKAATESDGLLAIRTRGAINTAAQIEHFAPLFEKHFGNVVSVQEGYHSFLGIKSDEKGRLPPVQGCVKTLGNKLCPSCRAFGSTNADIVHGTLCEAQALKARRAAAAGVAKKRGFQTLLADNKVEVARAAGKVKAIAARDGLGFCTTFNQTGLPCKISARCRHAPCVNYEELLGTAFKGTVYERMPSAVRLGTSRGRRGGRGRGGGGGEVKSTKKDWASFARGLARSPYHGGPRLESNEASLFEGSDDEL